MQNINYLSTRAGVVLRLAVFPTCQDEQLTDEARDFMKMEKDKGLNARSYNFFSHTNIHVKIKKNKQKI